MKAWHADTGAESTRRHETVGACTPTDAERIAALRQRCMGRKEQAWKDVTVPRAAALRESEHLPSWQERKGLCTRRVLSETVFALDELELLVGRLARRPPFVTDEALESARQYLEQHPDPKGQKGHCELDLGPLLQTGVDGVVEDIGTRLARASGQQAETYRSFLSALEGLTTMIENAATTVRSKTAESAPARQRELGQMADACEWVAHKPPRTFHEAIQLMWLALLGVQHGESVGLTVPGHLDRTLAAFYEADLAAGRLSRDRALLLIESLYLLINEFTRDGLAISIMVGGRDARGRDVTHELSYLCLEALRRTKLVYPTVGICWHEGTPEDLVDLAVDLISQGYANPALFGDETIHRGLRGLGVPPEQACNYINSTCVEITPSGASNVWVASPYFNLCEVLLEEIAACVDAPPASFEEFRGRYHARLRKAVQAGAEAQNELRRQRARSGRKPLQSVFTRDCVERGVDIDCGGAVYNWVECSFVGLANLADSLHVIRREVFEDARLTFGQLQGLLDSDFAGHEPVRLRFLNDYAKYGQDTPEVDALVQDTVRFVTEVCRPFRMEPDNSPFVPGAFVWVMHERLGRQTGATPDGRRSGQPFADGAGPAQGRETKGPTAAILSTTSWDPSPLIGGVAFNMRFNASLFDGTAGSREPLKALILTYLRRGGFEVQINVVDRQTLDAARANPDEYRDLVVRIGGYTDYFTRLSPEMQDEVMRRTEYGHV